MISVPQDTSKAISVFRVLATLLVVVCHTDDVMPPYARSVAVNYLGGAFSDANVCNFFFLSGFLLAHHFGEAGWWRRAILSRVRSFAVPYLIWCAVAFVLLGIFIESARSVHSVYISGGGLAAAGVEACDVLRRVLGVGPLVTPCDFPLWYLKTLLYFVFVSAVAFPILLRTRQVFLLTLCAMLAVHVCGRLLFPSIMPIFGFCFHLMGFAAFLAGAYCGKNGMERLPDKLVRINPVVPLAIWIAASASCHALASRVSHGDVVFTPINIAVAIFCLVWISFAVKWPACESLATYTFFIYASHMIVLRYVKRLVPLPHPVSGVQSVMFFVILAGMTTAICILCAHVMRLKCPQLAAILSCDRFGRRR